MVFREKIGDFTDLHNEKINLEVTCKRSCLGNWNSCKRLPNFVNVAALIGANAPLSIFSKVFKTSLKLFLNFFKCCLKIENDVMI